VVSLFDAVLVGGLRRRMSVNYQGYTCSRPAIETALPVFAAANQHSLSADAFGYFLRVARLRGTFAPLLRASDRPIAIACLRLVTFLPERPLRKVPALRSCIARFTFWAAFFPYRPAMLTPHVQETPRFQSTNRTWHRHPQGSGTVMLLVPFR
jgi:hypothetical protein